MFREGVGLRASRSVDEERRPMTSETIELPPGGPHHDSPRHDPPSSSGASGEPRPPGELTSSNDELSRLLSELATKPDRLLGSYSTEEPSSAQPPPPAPEAPVAKLEPEAGAGVVRRGRGPECVPVGDTRSAGDCVDRAAGRRCRAVAGRARLFSGDPLTSHAAPRGRRRGGLLPGLVQSLPRPRSGRPHLPRGQGRIAEGGRRSRRRKTRSMMRTSPRAGRRGRSSCF